MSLPTCFDLLNGGHDVISGVLLVPLPLQTLGRHIPCTMSYRVSILVMYILHTHVIGRNVCSTKVKGLFLLIIKV